MKFIICLDLLFIPAVTLFTSRNKLFKLSCVSIHSFSDIIERHVVLHYKARGVFSSKKLNCFAPKHQYQFFQNPTFSLSYFSPRQKLCKATQQLSCLGHSNSSKTKVNTTKRSVLLLLTINYKLASARTGLKGMMAFLVRAPRKDV